LENVECHDETADLKSFTEREDVGKNRWYVVEML
jgi:hypothetical protein